MLCSIIADCFTPLDVTNMVVTLCIALLCVAMRCSVLVAGLTLLDLSRDVSFQHILPPCLLILSGAMFVEMADVSWNYVL